MRYLLILLLSLPLQPFLMAQNHHSEEKEVLQTVERLFEGMRMGDSALVHAAFLDDAQLFTAMITKEGTSVLHKGSLQQFLNAVGSPHDVVWQEPIWNTTIKIDGNLAQVWTEYAFYAGNNFSHCGVDAFHLFKSEAGWKIFHLTDTRRVASCNVPDEVRKKYEQ